MRIYLENEMEENMNKLLYESDESNIHSPNNLEMKLIEKRVKEQIFVEYTDIIRDDVIKIIKDE